jgi:PHP family Zn ribbon phosphoesterase
LSTNDNIVLRKVDFHIHTPQSICYSAKSVTPEQIVEAALLSGLDAIAITDHNTFESVDIIRNAAKGKKLVIFPGIEISTKSGHFLALFEVNTPLTKLHETLNNIGIKRDGWGDAVMTAAGEAEEIFRKVSEQGGVVIAAHIERWPSGFLETKEPKKVKLAIHSNPYISALEITVSKDKALWNNGQMRGFHRKHACIQGSDAHSPIEIGRRPVFIRMNTISLAALRMAFIDYENNILFPEEIGTH